MSRILPILYINLPLAGVNMTLNLALPRVKMDIKKSNLVYVDQFDAMTVQDDDPKMLR